MKKIIIIVLGVFLLSCVTGGTAGAKAKPAKTPGRKGKAGKRIRYVKSKHGLKALIELGKSREGMIREINGETQSYRRVRDAIDHGRLKKGESASHIRNRYGEPVVILSERNGELTKWVYKAGTASFFSSEKTYLVFNTGGELVGWETLNPDP